MYLTQLSLSTCSAWLYLTYLAIDPTCCHRRTRRGVGRGGRPPRLEKFQGKLCFQGKRQLLDIRNVKSIFNTVKIFRETVFQGKRKLIKIPECEKEIQYSEKFQGNCFFRASASCSKILNAKSTFHTVKFFRATLFFRASASCSKILHDKKIYSVL